MAIRRRKLVHRIAAQPGNTAAVMAGMHPAAPPGTPMYLPVQVVTVSPFASGYVTLGAQDLAPLITADGAMVPAAGPGRWAQLAMAGRP